MERINALREAAICLERAELATCEVSRTIWRDLAAGFYALLGRQS